MLLRALISAKGFSTYTTWLIIFNYSKFYSNRNPDCLLFLVGEPGKTPMNVKCIGNGVCDMKTSSHSRFNSLKPPGVAILPQLTHLCYCVLFNIWPLSQSYLLLLSGFICYKVCVKFGNGYPKSANNVTVQFCIHIYKQLLVFSLYSVSCVVNLFHIITLSVWGSVALKCTGGFRPVHIYL